MAGTLVANTINTDTGLFSTNNAYLGIAKAWVNYNGATQTVTGSFNISSVTYNSTGNYTLNFTTAMPNTSYASLGTANFTSGVAWVAAPLGAGTKTTSALQVGVIDAATYSNVTQVSIAVFSS